METIENPFIGVSFCKNFLRNGMTQDRLRDLAIQSIESGLARKLILMTLLNHLLRRKHVKLSYDFQFIPSY